MRTPADLNITEQSFNLFIAYAKDAGNWSGLPLVGGNVGTKPADKGNLTQLKKAGLVTTFQDEDNRSCQWLQFTDLGKAVAAEYGFPIQS